MKKQLIIGSLLAFSGIASAQTWGGSTTVTGNAYRTGNVGINNTVPTDHLHIIDANTAGSGGITLTKSSAGNGAVGMELDNQSTGGKHWGVYSLGHFDPAGAGNFVVYDLNNSICRFLIDYTTGNVGLGTTTPAAGLHAVNGSVGLRGDGAGTNCTGAAGNGAGSNNTSAIACGVRGEAASGHQNYGGYFTSTGSSAAAGIVSYGLYANISSPGANDFAAYFNGSTYSTGTYQGSDKKLKDNIKPLTSALDKISLLKPSTYTFKTSEYKGLNLPEGEQMGLIAQELETVFPGLIKEVSARTEKNDKGEITASTPDYKSVNYIGLIPVIISGIQEQQQTISQLTQVNADLQKQLDEQSQMMKDFSQKLSGATGINAVGGVENGFQLSQNEPNPFTHETLVKYTLPQSVNSAFMAVYDLTGKQITTLPITEKGSASITITSEKLSAGIYIYSIIADGKVIDSKRMIVAQN